MNTTHLVRPWLILSAHSVLCVSAAAQPNKPAPVAAEPTTAREAAEKRAAEDKAIADKFAAWKATLSPQQQAWETLLEQNLGGFYLPLYQREKVRGSVSAWDPHSSKSLRRTISHFTAKRAPAEAVRL